MSEILRVPDEPHSPAEPVKGVAEAIGTPIHLEEFSAELPAVVDEEKLGVDLDGYVTPAGISAPHECPHEAAESYVNKDVELDRMVHDGLDPTAELGE